MTNTRNQAIPDGFIPEMTDPDALQALRAAREHFHDSMIADTWAQVEDNTGLYMEALSKVPYPAAQVIPGWIARWVPRLLTEDVRFVLHPEGGSGHVYGWT